MALWPAEIQQAAGAQHGKHTMAHEVPKQLSAPAAAHFPPPAAAADCADQGPAPPALAVHFGPAAAACSVLAAPPSLAAHAAGEQVNH